MDGLKYSGTKLPNMPIGEIIIKNGVYLMWDGQDWVEVQLEPHDDSHRLEELVDEFEKNPDLFNQVMVEMRNRKINKIKDK